MKQREFIVAVKAEVEAAEGQITEKAVGAVLKAICAVAASAVGQGLGVPLFGLGKLKSVHCKERQGRNPRTGEPITIPARRGVKFVPSASLKDFLKQ